MASMANLSPELLLIIFWHYIENEGYEKFLEVIPLVCKTWNKLSSDGSLWRDVKARNKKSLQYFSRRRLLYHTQSLKLGCNQSFYRMNLLPVLENIKDLKVLNLGGIGVRDNAIKLVNEHCPHLECLCMSIERPSTTTLHEFDKFFTVCGPKLRQLHLDFNFSEGAGQEQLLFGIAAKCPVLEVLSFYLGNAAIPIYELRSGCPTLRELEITGGHFMTPEINCSLGCGFKFLKSFNAMGSDFSGLSLRLLKDSVELERLELFSNKNLAFDSISEIPSNKVRILNISLDDHDMIMKVLNDPDKNFKAIRDALFKWRRSLSFLDLTGWPWDIGNMLQCLLNDNPNILLESLFINYSSVDPLFFQEFIQKCQNLSYLKINKKHYKNRKRIIRFALSLMERK